MNTSIKAKLKLILITITLMSLCSCSNQKTNVEKISRQGFALDTLIEITIYNTSDNSLLDECFTMCTEYENLFSKTIPNSDIARINSANTEAVSVSPETIELLSAAKDYYYNYNNVFDISISPVCDLWTLAREEGLPPSDEEIKEALSLKGLDKLIIDTDQYTVTKLDSQLSVDVGGIAKGYIADKLKEYLLSEGITSAIISLGGNIQTIGSKPDGSKFTIAIKKPFSDTNEISTALSVSDKTVVTAGTYERYFIYDKKIYHHIIDASTGYPSTSDLVSATIICDSSIDADALSTACILLGLKNATEVINNTPNVEAIFITSDNEIHYSSNAQSYVFK